MTRAEKIGVGLLLSVLLAQVFFLMDDQSPTADEFSHHVASGFSHLVKRDFRMNPAMPPLPRMLSAIPLYVLGAQAPFGHPSWAAGDSPEFARQFFYHNRLPMDALVFWARVPIAILSAVFGLSVYLFARKLFGPWAGFAALFLYVFCPDIVAHSSLATSDLAVAFFFFLTLVGFYFYLKKPSRNRLILTGLAAGLAFLSKFTAILLFPVLFLIAALSGKLREVAPKKTAMFLGVLFLTVWAGYFFETKPLLENTPDPVKKEAFLQKMGGEPLVRFARQAPIPLSSFISAFGGMIFTRARGTHSFLMGKWSDNGFWNYYLVAFTIKNTIPFLLLILLSLFALRKAGLDRLTRATLLAPMVFFFLVTLPDKAQVGVRYFLPIYPLFFVLCGIVAADPVPRRHVRDGIRPNVPPWDGVRGVGVRNSRVAGLAIAALLFWHAAEAVFVFPHDLAYFNSFAGGSKNGYKYLRDSNVDWGQDLKRLGRYVSEQQFPEVALFYFGPVDPARYGIPSRRLQPDEFETPRKTVYALGVHNIDAVKWTQRHEPLKVIGYSIHVYDFR